MKVGESFNSNFTSLSSQYQSQHSSPQVSAGFQSNQANLGAILGLIQQLISLLNQQQQKPNTPSGNQHSNYQKGSRGNDVLKGSSGDDQLLGRGGNDKLYGRAGDDQLFGGRGNDRLNGGKGNDVLDGGNGRDTLVSSSGSDTLDGGNGFDTARIRGGNIDDYEVLRSTVGAVGTDGSEVFVDTGGAPVSLRHKTADHSVVLENIERIKFNDVTVSIDELRALAGGSDNSDLRAEFDANKQKWLDSRPDDYSYTVERSGFLGPEARKPVDITVNGETVTDSQFTDGSGGSVPDYNKLSVSDLFDTVENAINSGAAEVRVEYDAELGYPTSIFIDQSQQIADEEVYLNASNLAAISENPQTSLPLTTAQKDDFAAVFSVIGSTVEVIDSNNDGKPSVGDLLKAKVSGEAAPVPNPTILIPVEFVLTEDNISQANGEFGDQLNIAGQDINTINQELNLKTVYFDREIDAIMSQAFDSDGSGRLSVGDVLTTEPHGATGGGNPLSGFAPGYHRLTSEDIDALEKAGIDVDPVSTDSAIALSAEQRTKLADIVAINEDTVAVSDNDGNGQLSAGDVVTGKTPDDTGQLVDVSYTLSDLALRDFNGELNNELAIDFAQAQELLQLSPFAGKLITIDKVYDQDDSGVLSAGDIVTTRPLGHEPFSLEYHELSASDIAQLQASGSGLSSPIVSAGGVNVGGDNIPDSKVVDINGQSYTVGFLKSQANDFASTFNPEVVDAAFGFFPWGTSNSLAAGRAFEEFMSTNFPNGEPGLNS